MDDLAYDMLNEAIKNEFEDLESSSSEEKKAQKVKNLDVLYRLKIEEEKSKRDVFDKKDRYFKYGIAIAEIVLPLGFYGIWMRKGLRFEETGTFTSGTFKGLVNRFRPTK